MGGTKFIFVERVKIARVLRWSMRALDDEARSEESGSCRSVAQLGLNCLKRNVIIDMG
jgi:hypothetical protein